MAVWQSSVPGEGLAKYITGHLQCPSMQFSIDKAWLQPVLICLLALTRQGISCWEPLFYNLKTKIAVTYVKEKKKS